MEKVFLSHSSSNKDYVRYVADKLGDSCIIDERSFLPGARTRDEIVATLNECDLFVIFISNNALDSPWVQEELTMALELLDNRKIEVLAFIIEKGIRYHDKRIPALLRSQYNLRQIFNPDIISARIRDEQRNIRLNRNSQLNQTESLFIGRSELIERAENDFGNIEGLIPTFMVASNYYAGIGRRKFQREVLQKQNFIRGKQRPVEITLSSTDSIETFILKLNGFLYNTNPGEIDLAAISFDEKIKIATELVKGYRENNAILSIVDMGAIVLPNHTIVDWFKKIASDKSFANRLTFCLVSQFRPNDNQMRAPLGFSYQIDELNRAEIQSLFVRLLNIKGKRDLHVASKEYFINRLSGNPSQIISLVHQICKDGEIYAKEHLPETSQRLDSYSDILLEQLKNYPLAYQIAILLSKDSVISFSVVEEVFGDGTSDNKELYGALAYLQDMSCISTNTSSQYLMLNTSLSDYIQRQRLELDADYCDRYNKMVESNMARTLDSLVAEDYSKFGAVINAKVARGEKIPEKYFLPSLILSFVVKEYHLGHYASVERLCNELLKNQNSDSKMLWDIKYQLARVYARNADKRFWKEINSPDFRLMEIDYNFLIGFFYRHDHQYDKALEHYFRILEDHPTHSRTLREVALTYNVMDEYGKALDYARKSYEHFPTDVINMQAYFVAIIRREQFDAEKDEPLLQDLLRQIKSSHKSRADDVARCVEGDYAYYVKHDINEAERILSEAVGKNEDRHYPLRALRRIYKHAQLHEKARNISRQLESLK